MRITDAVYGEAVLAPVLVELMNAPSLRRLRGISQIGYCGPFFTFDFSRFSHSVGVCVLLQRHGASIEEQIAGLIHDISHLPFSHCADYALRDSESAHAQDFHDSLFTDFVQGTEVPGILRSHGYDPSVVFTIPSFTLLEKNPPDLCADRIDYFLRQLHSIGQSDTVPRFLDSLTTQNGSFIFSDLPTAEAFALLYKGENDARWSGVPSAVMLKTTGDYLRRALSKGYLHRDDLHTTDDALLRKIRAHHTDDAHLRLLFSRMNGNIPFTVDSDGDEIVCKSRAVDPLCRYNGRTVRLSSVRSGWSATVHDDMQPKRYRISFVR